MWHRALLRRSGPALACLSVAALDQKRREVAEACGIVGVVGRENDDARGFLLEGLMVGRNKATRPNTLDPAPPSVAHRRRRRCRRRRLLPLPPPPPPPPPSVAAAAAVCGRRCRRGFMPTSNPLRTIPGAEKPRLRLGRHRDSGAIIG